MATEPEQRKGAEDERGGRAWSWELKAAWTAAIFSAIAAAGGWWSAYEAHRATAIATDTAALETQAALVESCGEATPSLFRVGDDFAILTASDGDQEFWNSVEPASFNEKRPKKPRVLMRCQYSNLSRVPLLSIYIYYHVGYHHNKTIKEQHSFPFALAPNATHAIWFFNSEKQTVVVSTPHRARYVRFPDLSGAQSQLFQPRIRDYWILYRDFDPDERLDESMM